MPDPTPPDPTPPDSVLPGVGLPATSLLSYVPAGLPGLRVAFTSVAEGNLALHVGDDPGRVASARAGLEARLGLAPGGLRFMEQVHSATVHEVPAGPARPGASVPVADALVSADASAALAVMVADCLPVVFAGTAGSGAATAVAHAGRRGLLEGVLQATVGRLRVAGAQHLQAWIGPAVCGRCYEVPAALAEEAEHLLPGIASTTSWGTPALDLPAAAAALLEGLGVAVESSGVCTLEDPSYYSYRRDPKTGRFAGLVWTDAPASPDPDRSGPSQPAPA
ncbi:laccase domain protein [Zafaria cholistanensis]|uniref:Laccase domain protein n=1 Tax=Zafaria cholistanensis TaxID=1682741 RepID=A0A5A7NVT5_9MICC|nr:polyphenol oxidase family protein [Zafaria cholistanensis]GER24377.1 laccase domain protein [Zafaria cholistanensis]